MKGSKADVREFDKEFGKKTKLAKFAYKEKVKAKLKLGNARDAWKGLKKIIWWRTKAADY